MVRPAGAWWAARAVGAMLLAAALVVVGGCERAAAPGPRGGTHRLVPLSPAIASILRSVGAGASIVGRHGFDAGSDPALPVCGDQAGVDYEALVRVGPTDIILQESATPPPRRLLDLARSSGWTVRVIPLLALDDLRAATIELSRCYAPPPPGATVAGAPAAAGLERLLGAMDRAWARRDGPEGEAIARAGRVLLLHAARPQVAALGPGSWHHQILERLGATPALAEGAPSVALDAEDVLRLRPDTIVLFSPRPPGAPSRTGPVAPADRGALLGAIAALDIPAAREGRLGLIDDPECLLPSLAMIGVAEDLAGLLARLGGLPPGP
jgi:ABC-type hemin transport system substrate-binding protein